MELNDRSRAAAGLSIVGGVLLCAGSFLAWADMSGGGTSVSARGLDGTDGYVTLAAGLIALVAGFATIRRATRPLAAVMLLVGLVGAGLGAFDALTAKDVILDAAAERLAPTFGATAEQLRTALDQAVVAGDLRISVGVGLYLVIAGGICAIVAGILGMRSAPMGATTVRTPPQGDSAPSSRRPASTSRLPGTRPE